MLVFRSVWTTLRSLYSIPWLLSYDMLEFSFNCLNNTILVLYVAFWRLASTTTTECTQYGDPYVTLANIF